MKSTAVLDLTGTNGTVIPAGSIVSVQATSDKFITDSEVTIAGGVAAVNATAQIAGGIVALAGTITNIDTPIFGWTTVNNSADAEVGREIESDADLRERRELSTLALGQNLVDSLFGQLSNLDGVEDALVIDNKTDATDANGIPAHQFLSVVSGGSDDDIADKVWVNTPQGINSHGSTTVSITDAQGFPQDVLFSRPIDVDIYLSLDITTESGVFPSSGVDDIKEAIVAYGAANFKISDDVILSGFYTPINSIPGVTSIDLRIGITPSPTGVDNIAIAIDKISRYLTSRIEVDIV